MMRGHGHAEACTLNRQQSPPRTLCRSVQDICMIGSIAWDSGCSSQRTLCRFSHAAFVGAVNGVRPFDGVRFRAVQIVTSKALKISSALWLEYCLHAFVANNESHPRRTPLLWMATRMGTKFSVAVKSCCAYYEGVYVICASRKVRSQHYMLAATSA